jgi:RNA polymerase sigma-70 factor (ECF subfamily)
MELVATSDERAQRLLVERLMARVRTATRALLRNQADAEDAAQLCMLEVLRSADRFRGEHEGSLEAWCDRITVRTALRYARKRRQAEAAIDGRSDPDLVAAGSVGSQLREEIVGEVSVYLERLSQVRREALVLRHVLGYTVEEIAELTGVSQNTVKDRLVHARREFRKLIRRERFVRSKGEEQP